MVKNCYFAIVLMIIDADRLQLNAKTNGINNRLGFISDGHEMVGKTASDKRVYVMELERYSVLEQPGTSGFRTQVITSELIRPELT